MKGTAARSVTYWFLTFEHAPELHALTKTCRQAIDPAYFDATPIDGLHLTLDRIVYDGASSPVQPAFIADAAHRACGDHPQFTLTFEQSTNLRGVVGSLCRRAIKFATCPKHFA
ncbi:hypothetical protein [Nocardia sp. NPDC047038]|uniref:hypothetical protein n=1 Tax=Nocardia sp. NPDC047038 TaxID=3154338 RepID=UPI0033CD03BE